MNKGATRASGVSALVAPVPTPSLRTNIIPLHYNTNFLFFDVLESPDLTNWIPYMVGCYGTVSTNGDIITFNTNSQRFYKVIGHNTLYPFNIK